MDQHTIVEGLLGLVAFFGGIFVRGLNESIKSLHEQDAALTKQLNEMSTLVAGDYLKTEKFEAIMVRLFEKVERINDKLDVKADKQDCQNNICRRETDKKNTQ